MILDRHGIADVFGVSGDTVRNWHRQGLPCVQEPKTKGAKTADERKRLYSTAQVHQWLVNRALYNRW